MTPRGVGEVRHAEVDGGGAVGDEVVELDEFGVGRGEADLEPAPTVREIASQPGLAVGTVHYHLNRMEAKGAIVRERWQLRGIRVR